MKSSLIEIASPFSLSEKCIKKSYFSKVNWFYSPLSHAVSHKTILIIYNDFLIGGFQTFLNGASRNAFPLKKLKNTLKNFRASPGMPSRLRNFFLKSRFAQCLPH